MAVAYTTDMKITKYVHSCLLIETPESAAIIDPGVFSWESGLLVVDALTRLDDIIITHEHPDHMHLPFIKALTARFPKARITTNPAVAAVLKEAGFTNVYTQSGQYAELFETAHESTEPLGPTPEHTGVHYAGQLTHPGDSHHFTETKDILALPVTAPWGTLMRAAELGASLHPRYIIPIHDWHWNDSARASCYSRLEAFFQGRGIQFIVIQDGVAVELDA